MFICDVRNVIFAQRRAIRIGLAGAFWLLAAITPVRAGCELAGGQVISVALDGNLSIPLSTPVGEVFKTVTIPQGPLMLSCDELASPLAVQVGSASARFQDVGGGVMSTPYPGLGVRITVTPAGDDRITVVSAARQGGMLQLSQETRSLFVPALKVELIKTGNELRAGQLAAGEAFTVPLTIMRDGGPLTVTLSSAPLTLSASGCILTSPDLTVFMPSVPSSRFGQAGDTGGKTGFSLSFLCASNQPVTLKASGIQADDNGIDGNALGILKNTEVRQPADGVGIQVLFNHVPVPLNTQTGLPLGTYSGAVQIPFLARYYQTGNTLAAGSVSASMSVTMSYD